MNSYSQQDFKDLDPETENTCRGILTGVAIGSLIWFALFLLGSWGG